jgi:hypothetical protein
MVGERIKCEFRLKPAGFVGIRKSGGVADRPGTAAAGGLPKEVPAIELDDWRTAVALLPQAAMRMVEAEGQRIVDLVLQVPGEVYAPAVPMNAETAG